jgi:hypothetical protein
MREWVEKRRVETPQLALHWSHVALEQEALQELRPPVGDLLERRVSHSPLLQRRIEPQVLQATVVADHHARALPVTLHRLAHRRRQLLDRYALALA